jgi:hypothetical protein
MEFPREYYADPFVRNRIAEFCGGAFGRPETFTAEYLVGWGESLARIGYSMPLMATGNEGLEELLDRDLDVFRSIWDSHSTVVVLDFEYFNLDSLSGLYSDQLKYFGFIEPVYRLVTEVFKEYGIDFLNDSTASGYHFVSRIPFSSDVHRELEELGSLEEGLRRRCEYVPADDPKRRRPVPLYAAKAYNTVGRLLEFLCHKVIAKKDASVKLPITISDVASTKNGYRREGISLDLTQYGDPLYMRPIRTSFSTHQKHKVDRHRVGEEVAERAPVFFAVPRGTLSHEEVYRIRSSSREAMRYAREVSSAIPDGSAGWRRVMADYRRSDLCAFHQEFDAVRHDPPESWDATYFRTVTNPLPPCVRIMLSRPNPEMLVPTNIRTLCRVLRALDWHPKHIGGLLRAYYERDFGWQTDWRKYDPETRANFWARIYCGLIAMGLDSLTDLNCITHQENGFCVQAWCGHNLMDYQKQGETPDPSA